MKKYVIWTSIFVIVVSAAYFVYKNNRVVEVKKSIEGKLSETYKDLKVVAIDLDRKDGRVSVSYGDEICMIEFDHISNMDGFTWQIKPNQMTCLVVAKIIQEKKRLELENENKRLMEDARLAKILNEINSFKDTADSMYIKASAEEKKWLDYFRNGKDWVGLAYFCGSGGCDPVSEEYERNLKENGWDFVYARDQKNSNIKLDDDVFTYGRWVKR